jgi:predicted alpha/beta-hydrolase family hydrolase
MASIARLIGRYFSRIDAPARGISSHPAPDSFLLLKSCSMSKAEELKISVEGSGQVSALLLKPPGARQLLLLAHGAGAGMRHPFMESLASELAAVHIATLRYQFPYMEQRRGRPDSPAVATATVAAAMHTASSAAPGLPLLAGGKSFGARMTSQAAAQNLLPDVRGLVFFGFPLHPPGAPGTKRADHLAQVAVPMLFLQGTRDTLADLKLLRPIIKKLGSLATLHIINSADHSFHVLKSSGKTDAAVLTELAQTTASWSASL